MRSLLFLAVLATASAASAQSPIWSDVSPSAALGGPSTLPTAYRAVELDRSALTAGLQAQRRTSDLTLDLPLPDGRMATVTARESSVMAPALQARYPEIQTYAVEGPDGTGRLAVTPHGVTALLFTEAGAVAIDPVRRGEPTHISYYVHNLEVPADLFKGEDGLVRPDDDLDDLGRLTNAPPPSVGTTLKTYRIAVAATGEYTARNGGGTVAGGLAAVASAVNRLSAIYERDLAVTFVLVADNDTIIYTDAGTDPFADANAADVTDPRSGFDVPPDLVTVQTVLDDEIGTANYDIGHVLGDNENGGIAYIAVACNSTYKASGVSGVGNETSLFDLLVFPHEIGHMLRGFHTWVSYNGTAVESRGVEPKAGFTIMGYGQFEGTRPSAVRMGLHLHAESVRTMNDYVRTSGGSSCGTDTATGNDVPAVSVPAASYTIPVGTPFVLSGSATDGSGSALTYTWDQMDPYGDGVSGDGFRDTFSSDGVDDEDAVPLFRSFSPSASASRTFPDPTTVWIDETLPSIAETYTFRLSARDNAAGTGAIGAADVAITTVAGSPFALTTAATLNVDETVTWDVAGTDGGTINVATVNVLFSDNEGASYDYVLASGTPNDGSVDVTFPGETANGRLKIEAVGNIFFATSGTFAVSATAPSISVLPASVSATVAPGASSTRNVSVSNTAASGSDDLTWSASVSPTDEWTDISTTGTLVALGDDDGTGAINLPFSFPFFGESKSTVHIASNGFLSFSGSSLGSSSGSVPSSSGPNDIIAMFWTDLDPSSSGTVHYQDLGDGRFAVQFTGVPRWGRSDELTFQAVLYDDGRVLLYYLSGFPDGSATVGIENSDGTQGASYTGAIANGQVIEFAGGALVTTSWLSLSSDGGSVSAGATTPVTFTLDATGLGVGTYVANVKISSDASNASSIDVPVTLTVSNAPTASIDGTDGWRTLALPGAASYDDLVGPWWTQGFPGADTPGGPCNAYTYSEATGSFATGWTCLADQADTFAHGSGLMTYVFADDDSAADGVQGGFPKTIVFDGAAGTAPYTFSNVTRTDVPDNNSDEEGWNLLGNPLGTAFDWDLAAPASLAETVYVYDPAFNGGDYRSWTRGLTNGDLTGGVVPAFQGFFVQATADAPGLEIPAEAVVTDPEDVYGRTAYDAAPTLRFELAVVSGEAATLVSSAFVAVRDDAQAGRDRYDALRLAPSAWPRATVSTALPGTDDASYLVNVLPADGVHTVPLEVALDGHAAGSVALSLAWRGGLAEGWTAELLDAVTGDAVPLTDGAEYRFAVEVAEGEGRRAFAGPTLPAAAGRRSATTGTSGDRFALRLTPPDAVASGGAEAVVFGLDAPSPNPSRGTVRLGYALDVGGDVTLSVFDALGRRVAVVEAGARTSGVHSATVAAGALAPGVYVARLVGPSGVRTRTFTVVR